MPTISPIVKDSRTLWFFDTLVCIRVAAAEGADTISVLEHVMPHGDSPPMHIHANEDEIFYILEGTFRFRVGDEERKLGKGETLIAPRGVPHSYRVESPFGRCLTVTTKGSFEGFVRAVGRPAEREKLPRQNGSPAPEAMAGIVEAAHLSGIEFVGPPLHWAGRRGSPVKAPEARW